MAETDLTPEEVLHLFRQMLLIRRFEERAGQLYAMGHIHGFCHLCIGREAVIAGLAAAAKPGDQIITSHRCHGHALAQGCDPKAVMAELLGRETGLNGGKAGSLHLLAPEQGFYGGHGVVGAPVSLAAGLAFANQYRSERRVTICTVGQGAADQGQVYETFTIAARKRLPVVFVFDNDTGEATSGPGSLHQRGAAFGIEGSFIEGLDPLQVLAKGTEAIDRARNGAGPTIIEALTYPFRGHANPDAGNTKGKARTLEEIDPIAHMKRKIIENGWSDEAAIKTIDRELRALVREAAAYAQSAAFPVAASLTRNVTAA